MTDVDGVTPTGTVPPARLSASNPERGSVVGRLSAGTVDDFDECPAEPHATAVRPAHVTFYLDRLSDPRRT